MRSKKITWQWLSAVIISLMMFSTPALAGDLNPSAPPGPTMKTLDQIPPTWDQILPASERFKLVMGGAAVLDKETGLVWEKSPSTELYTWDWSGSNAGYYCSNKVVGGRIGWRLPALHELASLVDRSVSGSSVPGSPILPSGHPFNNVQSSHYWSATTDANNTTYAWDVYFDGGDVNHSNKSEVSYVWCVRGGSVPDAQ